MYPDYGPHPYSSTRSTARVPEFNKRVEEAGYENPPTEEWPGALVGMEEIAAAGEPP